MLLQQLKMHYNVCYIFFSIFNNQIIVLYNLLLQVACEHILIHARIEKCHSQTYTIVEPRGANLTQDFSRKSINDVSYYKIRIPQAYFITNRKFLSYSLI